MTRIGLLREGRRKRHVETVLIALMRNLLPNSGTMEFTMELIALLMAFKAFDQLD